MDRNIFFSELIDILELDDDIINEETEINLTSLSALSIMALVYENFEKQIKPSDLQKVGRVRDLIDLIGNENFT